MNWLLVALVVMAVLLIRERSRRKAAERLLRDMQQRQDTARTDELASDERRELAQLQERLAVLERIATDENAPSAIEAKRIAEEIEALRDRQDTQDTKG